MNSVGEIMNNSFPSLILRGPKLARSTLAEEVKRASANHCFQFLT
jgi:hypothetical protein